LSHPVDGGGRPTFALGEGAAPAPGGDLDQDGLDDLTLAWSPPILTDSGSMYVWYGPGPTGLVSSGTTADATIRAGSGESILSVAIAADADGDCMPELAVGACVTSSVYVLRAGTF
jgi:hypothetical protein